MNTVLANHNRVNLHVEDTGGDGRPVILVHDWPLNMHQWNLQVPPLREAGYRVIAYDRRGFGKSEKPVYGYSYDDTAADLACLILDMDLTNVTIVGMGMGAAEAARADVLLGGERLNMIMLVSTVTPFMLMTEGNDYGWVPSFTYTQMLESLQNDREGFFVDLMQTYHSAGGELKITQQQLADLVTMCQTADQSAAIACWESVCKTDHRPTLEAVKTRSTVLHGAADAFAPHGKAADITARTLNDSFQASLREATHGMSVSDSHEFTEGLLRLLPEK